MIRLALRIAKNTRYRERLLERLGFTAIQPKKGGFWVHAVSVGEVTAAVPLVRYLLKTWPDKSVVVSTMTTTGADRVRKLLGEQVHHCYLPYDYPGSVSRFIRSIEPCLGLVMETEIWPNLILHCGKKRIPLIYANVRLSEQSFVGYRRFKSLFAPVLNQVTWFAIQSQSDAHRVSKLGVPEEKIKITGSMKFDMQIPPSVAEAGQSVRRQLGIHRPIIVAASTHEGEERLLCQAFKEIQRHFNDALLILVPRHPERFSEVFNIAIKQDLTTVNRSRLSGILDSSVEVLVVNAMGELTTFIAAGDVTFMAGSLTPIGGHNLLEAASLRRPVVFGPYMFNFSEISEMFLSQGAGIQIRNLDELVAVMVRLLADANERDRFGKQGQKLVEQNRGAVEKVLALVHQTVDHCSQPANKRQ